MAVQDNGAGGGEGTLADGREAGSRPEAELAHAYAAVERIGTCQTRRELGDRVRELVRGFFGAEHFVFVYMAKQSARRTTYRYLIGCLPAWCQLYNQRLWWTNDPFVEYARHHFEPILGSQVALNTRGQREMMAAAAKHGFCSGLVIPAHGGGTRLGMLYLGSPQPRGQIEQRLWAGRHVGLALAFQLMQWELATPAKQPSKRVEWDAVDANLLTLAYKGFTAVQAAAHLGIEEAEVERRYDELTRQLGTTSRKAAGRKALELGLAQCEMTYDAG